MHVALRIAYDGSRFGAYTRDPAVPHNVEGCLVQALRREGFVDGSLRTGSRTDKGVSARENILGATLQRPHVKGLVPAVGAYLPEGLWLTAATEVPADWNPRFVASRTYEYLSPGHGEDPDRMREACRAFVGRHDVRAFARLEEGRDPVREVLRCEVEDVGGDWRFTVQGRSFLWNQVRRTVDAVLRVGRGEVAVQDVRTALATGVRHARFDKAPAEGLVLAAVEHGLVWDAAAGEVPRRSVDRTWQEARVRAGVVEHIRGDRAPSPRHAPA